MRVGVIGLGTMGSMALWQLAKNGISAVGFEQFGIGHDRSAVGGESRLFRTAYREGAEYVPLLRKSRDLWRDLEQESGNSLLNLCGGLTIGKDNSDNVNNVLKSIHEYNINHEIFSVKEAQKMFPQHKFDADDAIILDKESGFLRPELAVVSAVNMAEKAGASVYRKTKIESIKNTENGVIVSANGERFEFDQIIVSAGSWASELLPQYEKVIEPRRILMSWFIPKELEQFQVSNFPIFARTTEEFDFFGTPTLDNSMVKIALVGSEEIISSPDSLNNNITMDEIAKQTQIVEEFFHDINPDPVRLSAHLDAYTPDEHAIVGRLKEQSNIVIMTGFSGHGFKLAPVMGQIASDLAIHGKTEHSIDYFNPSRFINEHLLK